MQWNGPKGLGVEGIGLVRKGDLWQSRIAEMRCVTARKGSRGTDVMGRVGYSAAGSVQRIGRAITGTERWVPAVVEFNG